MRKLAVMAFLLTASAAFGGTTAEQKCQLAKIKAQSKHTACINQQAANFVLGREDRTADCEAKLAADLAKADQRAVAGNASCRFLVNGPTAIDLNTNLMWERKNVPGCFYDGTELWTFSDSNDRPNGTLFTAFLVSCLRSSLTKACEIF